MQGTHFCPKKQPWNKARSRGGTEKRSPGISPAAKEGWKAQTNSSLPAPDSCQCNSRLQQYLGAFPVLLQHSLEQFGSVSLLGFSFSQLMVSPHKATQPLLTCSEGQR